MYEVFKGWLLLSSVEKEENQPTNMTNVEYLRG